MVTVIYSFTYQIFRGSINALKHMDFSLNFKGLVDIPAAAAYLADLVRIDSFDAQHYLDGAKGMDALYLMISLCRSGVAYVARAIAFMSAFGLKEAIEFHDSAGYRTFKDLAADKEVFPNNHVDKEWSKDDATKTPDEERGEADEEAVVAPKPGPKSDEERDEVNDEPHSPNSPRP